MNADEVPQDHNATLAGQRKVVYAKNAEGRLGVVASQGWEVEAIVTTQALENLQVLAAKARQQALLGEVSPLAYWMHERRMDETLLAQSSGFWQWQVRRHLKPQPFAQLAPRQLARYAAALGVSAAVLKTIPA